MSAKEYLEELKKSIDKRLSFNTFLKRLRHSVALEYGYIMSAVDYESIVMDLADLGEINERDLLVIKWEDKEK